MQHVLFAKVIVENGNGKKRNRRKRGRKKKRAHGVFITIIQYKTRAIIKFFLCIRAYINPWVFKSFSSSNSFKWIDCKHLIDEILCFRCYCVPFWRWILQIHAKYKQRIKRKPSQRKAISFFYFFGLSFDFLCSNLLLLLRFMQPIHDASKTNGKKMQSQKKEITKLTS